MIESTDEAWYDAVKTMKELSERIDGEFKSVICTNKKGDVTRRLIIEINTPN